MLRNIMIDLETMSTESNAAILSIGAVEMNLETRELGDEYYQNVQLSSCLKLGMHRSQSTLEWWSLDENKAARDALTKDAVSIEAAITSFVCWCNLLASKPEDLAPWSNGAGFDIPIIESAIKLCGRQVPWKFYNQSCFRTMKRLAFSIKVPRQGQKHNALDDAKHQARHLLAIYDSLMLRTTGGIIVPIELQERPEEKAADRAR